VLLDIELLQEASVFLFDKRTADKLHKPRRKETISEMLRHGVRQLERCRHPRLLHVLHSVEETADTLAFATEPVFSSLGNILAAAEDRGALVNVPSQHNDSPASTDVSSPSGSSGTAADQNATTTAANNGGSGGSGSGSGKQNKTPLATGGGGASELPFLDIEIKYGIFQVLYIAFLQLLPSIYLIFPHPIPSLDARCSTNMSKLSFNSIWSRLPLRELQHPP